MNDDALLLSVFRKLLAYDEVYVSISPPERGQCAFLVDGTVWDLTSEEADAVRRTLAANGLTADVPSWAAADSPD